MKYFLATYDVSTMETELDLQLSAVDLQLSAVIAAKCYEEADIKFKTILKEQAQEWDVHASLTPDDVWVVADKDVLIRAVSLIEVSQEVFEALGGKE